LKKKALGFFLQIKSLRGSTFYFAAAILFTGAAWLSSVRVVRCLVNSCSERNLEDFFYPCGKSQQKEKVNCSP